MQRKMSLGGIFLLFLLFCAITSYIELDTATTTEDISFTEEIIYYSTSIQNVFYQVPPARSISWISLGFKRATFHSTVVIS